jgi:hypothetical protein
VTESINPYNQNRDNGIIVRTFSQNVDEDELVWHRDERDRQVTVLEQTDWLFQFDNEIPKVLKDTIFIPRSTYHRLIKGTGDLMIQILEF